MVMRELSGMLPAVVTDAIAQEGEALTEIRLRPGCRVRLVSGRKDRFCGAPLAAEDFRRLLGAMMEHSYYAREEELAEKTKRLKELNILLNMDEKDKTLIDSAPDEGEEMPERKVVGLER